jgi:MAE_28990/MAE_18760-like HEPN
MKVRTLEKFEDLMSAEFAWRQKELTTLRYQVLGMREHAQPMAVRAGTALLYAHWEGFVKYAGQLYVEFVRQKKLHYDQLSTPFLGIALKAKMDDLLQAKAARVHLEFAEAIRNQMSSAAPLRPELVDTGANLSSARFREIVERLGLDYGPYELRQNLIDVQLLKARNQIAHGQQVQVGTTEFLAVHQEVQNLIREFRTDVLNAAQSDSYREQ